MSYKFDSLIIILNKLDGGEIVTVHSLMNELEVSERTIHRYIKTLQVAGFPIGYDRSKESYSFDEGYCLKQPNMSIEETLAFAMAKRLLGNFGGGMEKGLKSLEEKLSRKKAVTLPEHIILSADTASFENDRHLGALHHAITNFKKAEIDYKTLYSDEDSLRTIDPYYLFFQDGFWHLRAYCHLREDFRTFALDRITALRILDEHFLPKKIVPEDDLAGSFGGVVDGEPVEVVVRFDPEITPYILRKKWHPSQQETPLKDKRLEVRFTVNGFEGIKQWLYRWIPFVEVVGPKELREELKRDLKAEMQKHDAQ